MYWSSLIGLHKRCPSMIVLGWFIHKMSVSLVPREHTTSPSFTLIPEIFQVQQIFHCSADSCDISTSRRLSLTNQWTWIVTCESYQPARFIEAESLDKVRRYGTNIAVRRSRFPQFFSQIWTTSLNYINFIGISLQVLCFKSANRKNLRLTAGRSNPSS